MSENVHGDVSDTLSSCRSFLHASLSMPLIHRVAGAWPGGESPCAAGCATSSPLLACGCESCGFSGVVAGGRPGAIRAALAGSTSPSETHSTSAVCKPGSQRSPQRLLGSKNLLDRSMLDRSMRAGETDCTFTHPPSRNSNP